MHMLSVKTPDNSQVAAFSPLYQQIKQMLLQNLHAGEWRPGDAIPSEMDLAERYKVSQGTVRKAIDELAAENVLLRRQGKGTFVTTHTESHVQYRFLRLAPDGGEQIGEGPAERTVIDCKRVRANAEQARALGLKSGDTLVWIRRTLAFEKDPTILEDIYLPGNSFKGLSLEQLRQDSGPMYALFESKYGVNMVRAEEKLRALAADKEQAKLLKVPVASPLLYVERLSYTYQDQAMELRKAWYKTHSHHYRNVLK